MTTVFGDNSPRAWAWRGLSVWSHRSRCRRLATVRVSRPVERDRTSAALPLTDAPITVYPSCSQALAATSSAAVLPDPAGPTTAWN